MPLMGQFGQRSREISLQRCLSRPVWYVVSVAFWLATRPAQTGRSRWAMGLALFVALLGALTLAEYALDWNAGIDELLVRDTAAAFNQAKGILRVDTHGGVAPAPGCDAAHAGEEARVPYTATYLFLK